MVLADLQEGEVTTLRPDEFYPTPAWCIEAILDHLGPLPGLRWLEPCAGNGAMVRTVDAWHERRRLPLRHWTLCELREDARQQLAFMGDLTIGDFLTARTHPADVAILNPPFSLALEFVRKCLDLAPIVVCLERLNWLASMDRSHWLREHTPDVYVLPNRPSFTGGQTDACDYAWLVWPTARRDRGHVEILDLNAGQLTLAE